MREQQHELENLSQKPAKRFDCVLVILLLGFVGFYLYMGRAAPVPDVFAASSSLEEAIEQSQVEGKLVVAIATADWCGACQTYKRGALSNDRVEAWLRENAVPVYVNVDKQPEVARELGVGSIPATYVIADGRVVRHLTGAYGADALLKELEASLVR